MNDEIRLPFRIDRAGRIAGIEQGSQDELAQRVAMVIRTRPGDRVLVPGLGIEDPLFAGLNIGDVQAQLDQWNPGREVSITGFGEDHGARTVTIEVGVS